MFITVALKKTEFQIDPIKICLGNVFFMNIARLSKLWINIYLSLHMKYAVRVIDKHVTTVHEMKP